MKIFVLLVLLFASNSVIPATAMADNSESTTLRIATYNVSLYGKRAGQIQERLEDGKDARASKVAAIVQTVRPDVLLVNEIDYEEDGVTARLLNEKFFAVAQGPLSPIVYPYVYVAPSNTGIDSAMDLNANGVRGEPNDAWGYGVYPGQYSFAIYSRFPIDEDRIRSFRNFRWKDLPGAMRPTDPDTNEPYYDVATWTQLRLSSKNHVDVPIQIGEQVVHVLASHPTPPVFDGPEDRNGCRNHDEIRFWHHYVDDTQADYFVDDLGREGPLGEDQLFVIAGDLNTDSDDGDSRREAIQELIENPLIVDPKPTSKGAVTAFRGSEDSGGDAKLDTASFGRGGNMRVDYVLPCRLLKVKQAQVFWPKKDAPNYKLISASDHRMVWVEVELTL